MKALKTFFVFGALCFLLPLSPVQAAFAGTVDTSQHQTDDDKNWLQWRGEGRQAHAKSTGLLSDWKETKPKHLWTGEGAGLGYASLSISEGRIFTVGNYSDNQGIVAFSQKDGSLLWQTELTDSVPDHSYVGSRGTPTISGDKLYTVTSNGAIHCLKVDDGKVVWSRDFTDWGGKSMSAWGFAESPLVDGDHVICTPGGAKGLLVALNKETGETVWSCQSSFDQLNQRQKEGAGYCSMVISNAGGIKHYVQLFGRGLVGVRASDGELLWHYAGISNASANIPTPIVVDDYVFASNAYSSGAALLKISKDGEGLKAEEIYTMEGRIFQNHHGGMVRIGDYIYSGHRQNNGIPICIEWKTGKVQWGGKKRGAGRGSAAILYADGNLIYRYQDGMIALIEATPDSYKLKGTFKPDFQEGNTWAHPVIVAGKLYLRENDKIMCYDLKVAPDEGAK
ncbi:MAG: PQQ-like beta-propeller repeat protein [Pirellulaceae bacterium]|nr:PQQ-like beta-propeller repeat protein [Pirellulaceae bacterium]